MTLKTKRNRKAGGAADETEPQESVAAPEPEQDGQAAAEQPEKKDSAAAGEDWHDRYLRLAAEFDNFRKRSAREFGDLVQSAERDLIGELTEVLDNLDRALGQDHTSESAADFAQGVALIRDQLWNVLGKRGLQQMESLGKPFSPEAHDAMMRMPSDEYEEGCVMQEIAPGYMLGERVLRHAKVIVSQGAGDKPGPENVAAGDSGDQDGE